MISLTEFLCMILDISIVASLIIGHCYDNFKNGDETDVDCGGSCPECLSMHLSIRLVSREWPE